MYSTRAIPQSHCRDGEEAQRAPSSHRKRRGAARASITRLSTHLGDLKNNPKQPPTIDRAHMMQQRLKALDTEFQSHHHSIVDLIDDEGSLSKEQGLDEHDDLIADLTVRISNGPFPYKSEKVFIEQLQVDWLR